MGGAERFPQNRWSQDTGRRCRDISVDVSIFIAACSYHPKAKLRHAHVGCVPASEFSLRAVPAIAIFWVSDKKYHTRGHATVEPDGSQPVASCALFTEKEPATSLGFDHQPIQRNTHTIMRDNRASKVEKMRGHGEKEQHESCKDARQPDKRASNAADVLRTARMKSSPTPMRKDSLRIGRGSPFCCLASKPNQSRALER